jgi:hypothetical protein
MSEEIQSAWDRWRHLGEPGEMQSCAEKTDLPALSPPANTHIHLPPNFSAFDGTEQALSMAAAEGVRVLGVSNYYDFSVYAGFASGAWKHGILPIFGLEIIALLEDLQRASILINDPGNAGRMYICGKGITRFDPMTPAAQELMRWIRRNDAERMRKMVDLVEAVFARHGVATGLDEPQILDRLTRRYRVAGNAVGLQERHVAQAFQEEFFRLVPPSERASRLSIVLGITSQAGPEDKLRVQQEIRSALMKVGKPAFVTEKFVDFEQARHLILELGGIPCYPTLADGAKPICAYEDPPEKLVESLKLNGIFCAEFIPIRNQPEVLERYVRALRQAGIVVTAGTEHNTPDLLALEPRCLQGEPVPASMRRVIWEGACVVAAHQYCTLHGLCGYVDGAGRLNPDFRDCEERISFFARLGAAIVARYHEKSADEGVVAPHG